MGKGEPEVFNTDQGSQFTSLEFRSSRTAREDQHGREGAVLRQHLQRLWRTVKYEEVYLKAYANVEGAGRFPVLHRTETPSALGYQLKCSMDREA